MLNNFHHPQCTHQSIHSAMTLVFSGHMLNCPINLIPRLSDEISEETVYTNGEHENCIQKDKTNTAETCSIISLRGCKSTYHHGTLWSIQESLDWNCSIIIIYNNNWFFKNSDSFVTWMISNFFNNAAGLSVWLSIYLFICLKWLSLVVIFLNASEEVLVWRPSSPHFSILTGRVGQECHPE